MKSKILGQSNTPPKVDIDVRETLQLDRHIRWSLPEYFKSDIMLSQSISTNVLSREKEGNDAKFSRQDNQIFFASYQWKCSEFI